MKKQPLFVIVFATIAVFGVALLLAYTGSIALVSAQEGVKIPFLDEWAGSGHADAKAEAFVHWDKDSPAEVPVECAKCHSTTGYRDFLGADGSAAGKVDKAVPVGDVVSCVACHNDVTKEKTSVIMPSGLELKDLGPEARCMECHQGRESTVSVNEAIKKAGANDDKVSADLGFKNIHYFAAAATKYGTLAKGGYEYEGQKYDGNFAHVEKFNSCVGCHDSHTLELKVEKCASCHKGVAKPADFHNVRMNGSLADFDGDGNIKEGIFFELEGVRDKEFLGIQAYAKEVAGKAIVYDSATYPYFFADTNGNGKTDKDEAVADNGYKNWTPRLLKAAYNYQTSIKDPGAYAHGGKYIIELLYDSLSDLNTALAKPIDMAAMRRTDPGHFAGSEEAFRHWDADGEVPAGCARCHSGLGLATYLKDGANVSAPLSDGLQCANCHNDLTKFTLYEAGPVKFPSGAVVDSKDPQMNLCLNCHQGRESTVSVNDAIKKSGATDDKVSADLAFKNVHYFAAGATIFGDEVKGAYQYDGKKYFGRFMHDDGADTCLGCHSAHEQTVQIDKCADCHDGVKTLADARNIREGSDDWDGDGNTTEGIAAELDTMQELLYKAIQAYASKKAGAALVYNPDSYPYFYADANNNGKADPDEKPYANWTPRLLKAAYNYQYAQKDPGAFTHNGQYIIQVLYDSIEDIGGDVKELTRP